MSSTSRFKKLWRQSSVTSKSPTPTEGERKLNDSPVIEDDNIINLSKSTTNEKPTKNVDRRTSKTKRGDVKARSVNLGGLIGLWKGIESLDKDGEKIPVPQNRTPSLDRKYIKDRKISIEKKAERKISVEKKAERKISVGKKTDPAEKKVSHEKTASGKKESHQVEQTVSKDKNHSLYKDIDVKEIYKDVKKPLKVGTDSSVTSLLSKSFDEKRRTHIEDPKSGDSKRQLYKDVTKTNDWRTRSQKVENKQTDRRKGTHKEESKSEETKKSTSKTPLITVQSPEPETEGHVSQDKTCRDAEKSAASLPLSENISTSSPDLHKSKNVTLRRSDSKRHSFRRRSKVDGDNTKLAEDFDKIFKRLSIGSELSISDADISSILDQVTQNQEREKEKKLSYGENLVSLEDTNTSEKKITDDNKKTEKASLNEKKSLNDNKIIAKNKLNDKKTIVANKTNEKSVVNDRNNSIRKPTSLKPIGRKDIPKTKVSNFEEGLQKERTSQEKHKTSRKNEVSIDKTDKRASASGSAASKGPSTGTNEKKDSSKPAPKTATQAKLEEIAARREALRRKYLERSHSENSIALEKKERFRRQGFSEGNEEAKNGILDQLEVNISKSPTEQLTCEVASVSTNILSPEITSPEWNSTDSGFSAESRVTQISNRADSSSSEEKPVDKKKKKLIRKNLTDTRTPPTIRKNRDVQKILRRLSLNIPPPTPEEIEEEIQQGQDLTELERRKLAIEKRRRSLQQNSRRESTESEHDGENKKENNLKSKVNKPIECNNPDDLDHMISKANKSSGNNLTAFSEQKFKAMKNQSMQRSSSADEPDSRPRNDDVQSRNTPVKDTFIKEKDTKVSPSKKVITPRASISEKKQKLFDPPKDIHVVRTKPVSETREQVKELVSGKSDNQSPNKDNKKGEKSPRKDRMLNQEHPSQRTFKKQSEWLEKLVAEAASNEKLTPTELSKSRDFIPTKIGRRHSTVEKKPEIDKEAIRENVVEEPTNLVERRKWLEKLVRRNSMDKKTRLSKTMSLCNLSSLNFEDDDDDISTPITRQVSVEEISKSIDLESRGNAFLLPSAIRKRRSMVSMESLEQNYNSEGALNNDIHSGINNNAGHMNGDLDDNDDIDPNIKETLENIQLPNIHERMKNFQQVNTPPVSVRERRIPRKQRPKSYAGEHLSQLVFEDGSFRPKDGQLLGDSHNCETVSSIGRVLMVDSNSVDSNNNALETPRETMMRKRQNRRSLFSNQRILAEIAEMEQREQEIIDERTKATDESTKHIAAYGRKSSVPIKDYERGSVTEEKSERLKTYPKGLEAFLKENEVRT